MAVGSRSYDLDVFALRDRAISIDIKQLWIFSAIAVTGLGELILSIDNTVLAIFFGPVLFMTLFALLRVKALWAGVIIDPSEQTMEFPGGHIALSGVLGPLRPSYLFQYFLRIRIDIRDLTSFRGSVDKLSARDGGFRPYLFVAGSFGTAQIAFSNERERDDAYRYICVSNRIAHSLAEG